MTSTTQAAYAAGVRVAHAGSGRGAGHLHKTWAYPCHICTRIGLTPATSAQGLGSPLPNWHKDWAHPCHIFTRIRLTSTYHCMMASMRRLATHPNLNKARQHRVRTWDLPSCTWNSRNPSCSRCCPRGSRHCCRSSRPNCPRSRRRTCLPHTLVSCMEPSRR